MLNNGEEITILHNMSTRRSQRKWLLCHFLFPCSPLSLPLSVITSLCVTAFSQKCCFVPEQKSYPSSGNLLCKLFWLAFCCIMCVCVHVCVNGTWQTHCLETVHDIVSCHLLHRPLNLPPSRCSGNIMRAETHNTVTQIHVHRQISSFFSISEKKRCLFHI